MTGGQTLRALWAGGGGGASTRPFSAVIRGTRATFLSLLQQAPRGVVHELRRMNQYGILGRIPPRLFGTQSSAQDAARFFSTCTPWISNILTSYSEPARSSRCPATRA